MNVIINLRTHIFQNENIEVTQTKTTNQEWEVHTPEKLPTIIKKPMELFDNTVKARPWDFHTLLVRIGDKEYTLLSSETEMKDELYSIGKVMDIINLNLVPS